MFPNLRFASALGYLALGSVLAAGLPLLLVAQVADVGRSDAWRLTLALTVWAGLRLTMLIAAGRPALFDFFFWLFVYIFMGIAPTVQIRSDQISPTTAGIDEGLDTPTALVVVLGVLCYEVGRYFAKLREGYRAETPAVPVAGGSAWPASPVVVNGAQTTRSEVTGTRSVDVEGPATGVNLSATLFLVAAGVLASTYFILKLGPGALFGSRDEAFGARTAAWPDPAVRAIMYALAIYPLLVGIGALAQLRGRWPGQAARWITVLMLVATALLLLVVNPVSSARYSLGTVLFALAVYAGAVASPGRLRATLVAVIAGFIFLFPVADAFRRPEVSVVRAGFFGEYRGNSDYDAFWQIANSYSFLVDGLLEPGRQALGVIFFWVPRSFWTDKPVDTGIMLANYRGYSFDNLSAPLWAEFLVNGGVAVLVGGFVLFGFLLRRMDTRLAPAFAAGGFWAIAGAIYPVYLTILMRGSLLQATGIVAVASLCLLIVRARQPSSTSRFSPQLTPGTPAQVPSRPRAY